MPICSNCASCSCKVYPQGNPVGTLQERPLMVIGEAPTPVEARNGRAMTGDAGNILRQTLQKVGLPFDENAVYYTNAVACAVPKPKDKTKTFPRDAIYNCRDRLLEEIKAVKPKMILVCGKVAWQMVSNNINAKVTSDYGRIFDFAFAPGGKIMPVMNPGLMLHSPGDYKPFLAMMQLASTVYHGGAGKDTGTTTWKVLMTKQECMAAWNDLHDRYKRGVMPRVAMDIETTGLDYRTADFLVLGICYEKNKAYVVPRERMDVVHNFIEGVPWKQTWHNGMYDKKVMWRRRLANVPIDNDTIYMHYVFDETSAHDLGYLSKAFLQAEEYKYKMNQSWKNVTLDTYHQYFDALCERVAVDVDYTFQLAEFFLEKLEEEPTLKKLYQDLLIPASNFLSRVQQNGNLMDAKYLRELDVKYQDLLEDIKAEIQGLVEPFWNSEIYAKDTGAKSLPDRFNPGSPAQMAWLIFDRLKLKPRIKKGRSTDKDILESIQPAPPIVEKVLEYRATQKEHSTYVLGLLEARDTDGRVRTNFTLHVTATGRLSSKEPNIQNQPSAHGVGNIRKAFIPRPGYVLAEIDYSGAELRWLAYKSQCPVLLDVFMKGRNLHNETSKSLFGPDYTKAQKMQAKAVNFGIPYGREPQSIAEEFNIPKAAAAAMISKWLDTYYGARDYLQWCADQVVQGNYMESQYGRRRRFGLVSKESLHALQNEAKNFPIQSASSDTTLMAAMELEEPLLKRWQTYILNLVHDSIVLEIPAKPEIISEVGAFANDVLVNMPVKLFNCPVPFKTDFEVGHHWGDTVGFNYKTGKIEEEVHDEIIVRDFYEWLARPA